MSWRGSPDDRVARFPGSQSSRPRAIEPFEVFSPGDWYGKAAPAYDWMVDGCLLRGTVGMLSGDGGIGKSLLMQQLLTAASTGRDWLGFKTQKCRTFGFFCEDDRDELHRRQERINTYYGCEHPDVEALYVSRVGMENVLLEFDRRTDRPLPTPVWDQLQASVVDFGAQIVVLDTIADTYGGNEIVRNQVRRFITELRRLAVRIQGVVIITAHPSNVGMSSGTGISGSTAWHNSVRSRMYLTKPRRDPSAIDETEEDSEKRLLKTMKNNQGPGYGNYPLKWQDGVFVVEDEGRDTGFVYTISVDNAVFDALSALVSGGSRVARDRLARTSMWGLSRQVRSLRSYRREEIDGAVERLLKAGRIEAVKFGPPTRRYQLIRPIGMKYDGEGNP